MIKRFKQGDTAPDFIITASNGNEVSLSTFLGTPLILFFYPKNTAKDCVSLLSGFRDLFSDFKKEKVRLVGISVETLDSHNKFIAKYRIPFLLLCDTNMKMCRQYGVYRPRKVAGTKVWGVARTTFVVDKNGKIVKIYENIKDSDHAKEVLSFMRTSFRNL